ncbi:hypothetical protein HYALB_00005315 [Hymenoscyphus albidus]|uniref:2EXR domain-containing protein n=1 Tax=Hymenoscyphus albidus TaxID=595503 RepID=A0A9N9M1E9_9HELO|nr:hypothetical protein HYALB_00005315 [Hymenoscyphus albidus]
MEQPTPSTALAPTTFTLFPKLPAEIQIKIWEMAMKDAGRVVEMMVYTVKGYPRHYCTDAKVPDILLATHAARAAVQPAYGRDWTLDAWTTELYNYYCGTLADAGDRLEYYGTSYDQGDPWDEDLTSETFDYCPRPAQDRRTDEHCPLFRHRINFEIDILYLNLNHCTTKFWTSLYDMSPGQPVERVAIQFEEEEDPDTDIWDLFARPTLREVFLVFGDIDCCNPNPSGHKRIKELSTDGVVIPAEFNDRIAQFEVGFAQYWMDEICAGMSEEEKDEVVVPSIIRARHPRRIGVGGYPFFLSATNPLLEPILLVGSAIAHHHRPHSFRSCILTRPGNTPENHDRNDGSIDPPLRSWEGTVHDYHGLTGESKGQSCSFLG